MGEPLIITKTYDLILDLIPRIAKFPRLSLVASPYHCFGTAVLRHLMTQHLVDKFW